MKICSKCGKGINDSSDFCPSCGFMVEDPIGDERPEEDEEYEEYEYDTISVGLCILAVLIPLFGFIYWGIEREKPRRVRACLIAALISVGIVFLYNLIVLALTVVIYS